jgi:hypothetical protein
MGLVEIITVVDGQFKTLTAYETQDESELQDAVHTAASAHGTWQSNAAPSEFATQVRALASSQ